MQLSREVERLRLDLLAIDLSTALAAAGIPHAVIKGPSTALWLYDPPRGYRDVDLLVPMSQVQSASDALSRAHLASSRSGRVSELAPHSLLLHSTEGYEVDLHLSLPLVPAGDGDGVWNALAPHIVPLHLDVGTLPSLDEAGRCVVVALHALSSPPEGQAAEDLGRAVGAVDEATWNDARLLADQLLVRDLFEASLARATGAEVLLSDRARLYISGASGAPLGVQRLAEARRRDLPRLLWHELLPSQGFMEYATVTPGLSGFPLVRAHFRRWRRILVELKIHRRSTRQ